VSAAFDQLYRGAAVLAAGFIAGLCLLIVAQVLLNAGTRMGLPLPPTIPSYADFAGFMLAAGTFLALPWTLMSGGHVRVSLVTSRLPRRLAWGVEIAVLGLAAAVVGFAAFYAGMLLEESHRYGDTSPGIVAIPLWVPQVAMVLGLALLCLALVDALLRTLRAGAPVVGGGEEG
jgi:TRAP-type C4-dicarboxylate transport system permease small subunit